MRKIVKFSKEFPRNQYKKSTEHHQWQGLRGMLQISVFAVYQDFNLSHLKLSFLYLIIISLFPCYCSRNKTNGKKSSQFKIKQLCYAFLYNPRIKNVWIYLSWIERFWNKENIRCFHRRHWNFSHPQEDLHIIYSPSNVLFRAINASSISEFGSFGSFWIWEFDWIWLCADADISIVDGAICWWFWNGFIIESADVICKWDTCVIPLLIADDTQTDIKFYFFQTIFSRV